MKNLIFALMISALPALGAPRVVGLPSKPSRRARNKR